jgi:ectoine hydroxylase-related dioxygenase (phytanoyl-CoA dioxygenase family)
MHFLPGSHRRGVLAHRHIGDDPAVHGLVADGVDGRGEVAVPLAPGGATFHHCRTLHRTPPNTSDRARRAWANEVQVEPEAQIGGDEPDRPWVRAGREAWARRRLGG